MNEQAVYAMKLTKVYPLLVAKAERKGRTQQEADAVMRTPRARLLVFIRQQ